MPPDRKPGGGRPPKYDEPSRPVTLTLPDSVLDGLAKIDPDRGKAITKLTAAALRDTIPPEERVEVLKVAPKTGLLVIGPCQSLKRIPFLRLVEVSPARYLLALLPGQDFLALEVAIRDILDEIPADDREERPLLLSLLQHIKRLRKADQVSMGQILLVNL